MSDIKLRTRGCGVIHQRCGKCGSSNESFFVEGDSREPRLMQCSNCHTVFYYEEETSYYHKPLNEQLDGKVCPECSVELKDHLKPYKSAKTCSNCDGLLLRESVEPTAYREFYDLYSDVLDQ